MKQWFAAPLILLAVAGCAKTRPLGGSPDVQVIDAHDLPVPTAVDTVSGAHAYRIGVGDELTVDVAGFEETKERKFVVDGNGRISVPQAGGFQALDKTPEQIEVEIVDALKRNFVRNPVVSVNVSEVRSQNMTVDGQVTEPGVYPVTGKTTLVQAIARAKGLSEFARLEDVVIFRTVGDRRYVALYNLEAIRRGAYPDPQVYPEDVVLVGESRGRRMFKDILMASPLLLTPLVAILQSK